VIAKITKRGGDPGGIAGYLHGPGRADEHRWLEESTGITHVGGAVIGGTIPVSDPRIGARWVSQMRETIALRPDITAPVWHASLRLAPGDERLSDFAMAAAAARFMEGMGLEANPWVVIRDAPDACHIVASRVDHAAEVWKGRLDQREAQRACQAVEAEFGLVAAPRGRNPDRRAPSQRENWVTQRTGQVSDRAVLAEKVLEAAQRTQWSGSLKWFERACADRGVLAVASRATGGNRTVSGYRFALADAGTESPRWHKGSQVAGGLSWPTLRARIAEPSPEELRTMPILQQTWAHSQATAGRMQTHGVTPARSASTHPSRSAAAPTRRPDRGFGR